jgi:TRAP-type transport system small permease protein
VARVSLTLAAVCFALFVLMVLAQVGYRYLGISMVFSEEAARLINVYSIFFGLVFVVHSDADIRINLIDNVFVSHPRIQYVAKIGYLLLTLIFFLVLLTGSYLLMVSNWRWALPSISFLNQGHVYMAPFISCCLSIPIILFRLYFVIIGAPHPNGTVEDI